MATAAEGLKRSISSLFPACLCECIYNPWYHYMGEHLGGSGERRRPGQRLGTVFMADDVLLREDAKDDRLVPHAILLRASRHVPFQYRLQSQRRDVQKC